MLKTYAGWGMRIAFVPDDSTAGWHPSRTWLPASISACMFGQPERPSSSTVGECREPRCHSTPEGWRAYVHGAFVPISISLIAEKGGFPFSRPWAAGFGACFDRAVKKAVLAVSIAAMLTGVAVVHGLQLARGSAPAGPGVVLAVAAAQLSFFVAGIAAVSILLSAARRRLQVRVWLVRYGLFLAAATSTRWELPFEHLVPGGIPEGHPLWISVAFWPNLLRWVLIGVIVFHSVLDVLRLVALRLLRSELQRSALVTIASPLVFLSLFVAWGVLPAVGVPNDAVVLAIALAGAAGFAARFAFREGGAFREDSPLALLAERSPEKAAPLLEDALEHGPPALKAAAIVPLARMRGAAFEERLLPLLQDASEDVRRAALMALGEVGTSRAVAPIGEAAARFGFDATTVIRAIQERLAGAEPGQLSAAEGDGRLSMPSERVGALSVKKDT